MKETPGYSSHPAQRVFYAAAGLIALASCTSSVSKTPAAEEEQTYNLADALAYAARETPTADRFLIQFKGDPENPREILIQTYVDRIDWHTWSVHFGKAGSRGYTKIAFQPDRWSIEIRPNPKKRTALRNGLSFAMENDYFHGRKLEDSAFSGSIRDTTEGYELSFESLPEVVHGTRLILADKEGNVYAHGSAYGVIEDLDGNRISSW